MWTGKNWTVDDKFIQAFVDTLEQLLQEWSQHKQCKFKYNFPYRNETYMNILKNNFEKQLNKYGHTAQVRSQVLFFCLLSCSFHHAFERHMTLSWRSDSRSSSLFLLQGWLGSTLAMMVMLQNCMMSSICLPRSSPISTACAWKCPSAAVLTSDLWP